MKSIKINGEFASVFVRKITVVLCGVIILSLVTRVLGPSGRGRLSFYLNLISIVSMFLSLGVYQMYPSYKKQGLLASEVFINIFMTMFFLYIVLGIIACIIFFRTINAFSVILLIPITILSIQLNYLLLIDDIKAHGLFITISNIVSLLASILVYFFDINNVVLMLYVYLSKDIVFIILYILTKKIKFRLVPLTDCLILVKKALVPLIVSILIVLGYKVDILLLKIFSIDNISIGIYSAGVGIAEYVWFIPDIFKDFMINCNTSQSKPKDTAVSLRLAICLILLSLLFLTIFGKFVIKILYGNEFLKSYNVLLLMLFAVPFMALCKIIGTLLISDGKWMQYLKFILTGVLVNIVVNVVLIQYLGIYGSAIASIVSYSVSGFLFLNWFINEYDLNIKDVLVVKKSDYYFLLRRR